MRNAGPAIDKALKSACRRGGDLEKADQFEWMVPGLKAAESLVQLRQYRRAINILIQILDDPYTTCSS